MNQKLRLMLWVPLSSSALSQPHQVSSFKSFLENQSRNCPAGEHQREQPAGAEQALVSEQNRPQAHLCAFPSLRCLLALPTSPSICEQAPPALSRIPGGFFAIIN